MTVVVPVGFWCPVLSLGPVSSVCAALLSVPCPSHVFLTLPALSQSACAAAAAAQTAAGTAAAAVLAPPAALLE